MPSDSKHMWFRLNAMGVLIAMLEVMTGVDWIVNPTCLRASCEIPVVGWFVHLAYIVSGLMLLVAYWKPRADLEVYGLCGLLVANVVSTVRNILFSQEEFQEIMLSVIVAGVVALRLSALLQGGTITLPPWQRRTSEEQQ